MRIVKHNVEPDARQFVIAPIGDIQWSGLPGQVAERHLTAHMKRCHELGAHYVGLGDYIDFMSPSNRLRLAQADLYDNATEVIRAKARQLTEEVHDKYLKQTASRWLGMVSGHHYTPLSGDETTDTLLAGWLHAPFTESVMYIRLQFSAAGGRSGQVDILALHGNGSAKALLTKLRKMSSHFPHVDLLLAGHCTARAVDSWAGIYPVERGDTLMLRDKPVWAVLGGGWSRAYQETETGYVEKAFLPPVTLGAPLITVVPEWTRQRRFVPSIRVEA